MEKDQLVELVVQLKTMIAVNPDGARSLISAHVGLGHALLKTMVELEVVDADLLQKHILAYTQAANRAAAPTPAVQPPAPMLQAVHNLPPPPPPPTSAHPTPVPTQPLAPIFQGRLPPPPPPQSALPPYMQQQQQPYGPRTTAPTPPMFPPAGRVPTPQHPPPPQSYGYPQHQYGAPPSAPAQYQQQPPPPPAPTPAAGPPASALAALSQLPEEQRAMVLRVVQMTPAELAAQPPQERAMYIQLRQQLGVPS